MANTGDEIEFPISAEDMTKAGIDSAKKNLDGLGRNMDKTSQAAKLGFWGIGEAAENSAQSMGVPFQMSKKLGNAVEDLAASMGRSAIAFGVVGVAAMALYAIYSKVAEEKQKLREEDVKAGQSAASTLESLTNQKNYTAELWWEIDRLNRKKREMASEDLVRGIDAQKQKIAEMSGAISDQGGLMSQFLVKWKQAQELMATGKLVDAQTLMARGTEKLNHELKKELLVLEALELQRKKDKLDRAGLSKGDGVGMIQPEAQKPSYMLDYYAKQAQMEAGAAGVRLQQAKNDGAQLSELHQRELEEFDYVTQAKLSAAKNLDDAQSVYAQREVERQAMVLAHDRQTSDLRLKAAQDMAGGLAQAFQTMYQIGGASSRKWFSMYKTAAIAETMISTYKAAQDAYAFGSSIGGPILGGTMAAIATAAGLARVAAIRAQQFGGGAAGAAVGTGGAGDYSTMGRDNNPYRYFNYEQSKYGTGWRPGEGGGTTYVLNNSTIIAQDSDSFQAKVSGAMVKSMKMNEHGVNDTMRRYA